ncbi:thiamine diphosphokinase [Paenibacillus sp. N1-5-1-14]|uniref:thiamine diphosphokinase n=1 Tax=Paenibacillus radicibacter TaxID=2972488 RepID=UPI00215944F2|nr:thiamine diphosphokinase [Paenibacillus radicibacter]MCR8643562.1 thiamine diphosphokinase [Paenibacillus radicibacter]
MTLDRRIVIVSGGQLGNWLLDLIRPDDILVGADRGAFFLIEHGLKPDLALGDFDSVAPEELQLIREQSKQFMDCDPIDKDYTDTELALNWALEQCPASIVMLGTLGTRFDHSLANIHLLRNALTHGTPCVMIDAHNEIRLIDEQVSIAKGDYTQVSLLPLSIEVTGINLKGFQYPLHNATLQIGQSLGISNVLLEPTGTIEIASGLLLVIQSRD